MGGNENDRDLAVGIGHPNRDIDAYLAEGLLQKPSLRFARPETAGCQIEVVIHDFVRIRNPWICIFSISVSVFNMTVIVSSR